MAITFTAHFFGTIDAYSTARPGRLISPTNVAAVICHVLSAGFSQLGYGTGTIAPKRWITKALLTVVADPLLHPVKASPNSGYGKPIQTVLPVAERMQGRSFRIVTAVFRVR